MIAHMKGTQHARDPCLQLKFCEASMLGGFNALLSVILGNFHFLVR